MTEAITRMKQNGDVMRSDRLKQVMQEIDRTFDEKNLGMSKFSRFCQEAAQRGLLSVTKLENGQLEVDVPGVLGTETPVATPAVEAPRVVELSRGPARRGVVEEAAVVGAIASAGRRSRSPPPSSISSRSPSRRCPR